MQWFTDRVVWVAPNGALLFGVFLLQSDSPDGALKQCREVCLDAEHEIS